MIGVAESPILTWLAGDWLMNSSTACVLLALYPFRSVSYTHLVRALVAVAIRACIKVEIRESRILVREKVRNPLGVIDLSLIHI